MLHRIAHWLGWNRGAVISWTLNGRQSFVGFRCHGCGKISGIEETTLFYERTVRYLSSGATGGTGTGGERP